MDSKSVNRLSRIVIAVMGTLVPGCTNAVEAEELKASDLIIESRDGFYYTMMKADPLFSRYPWAWSYIKNEGNKDIEPEVDTVDLCMEHQLQCWDVSTFKVNFSGQQLVSVLSESDVYGGGAHGVTNLEDYTFDIKTKERILFGNIFKSWTNVQPILQKRFCNDLKFELGDDLELMECPNIGDTALTIGGGWGEKASVILVNTSDYQLGSYAAGRTEQVIVIDDEIRSHIKPEYLVDVEVE